MTGHRLQVRHASALIGLVGSGQTFEGHTRTARPSRSAAEGSYSAVAFACRGRAPAYRRGASQSRSPDRPLDHAEPPRSPRPTGEPFGRRCTTGVDRTHITSVSPVKVAASPAALGSGRKHRTGQPRGSLVQPHLQLTSEIRVGCAIPCTTKVVALAETRS